HGVVRAQARVVQAHDVERERATDVDDQVRRAAGRAPDALDVGVLQVRRGQAGEGRRRRDDAHIAVVLAGDAERVRHHPNTVRVVSRLSASSSTPTTVKFLPPLSPKRLSEMRTVWPISTLNSSGLAVTRYIARPSP